MSPRDPNSLDDRSDLAELLELLNSFAQDAGPADSARDERHQSASVTEAQTAPVTEARAAPGTEVQTPPEIDDRQTDLNKLLEVAQNLAEPPVSPYELDHNRFAAHIIASVTEAQTAPETEAQIAAEIEAQTAPETEVQTPPGIEDLQTDLNKLLQVGQNLAEPPVGPYELDHNRFAAHIIQGMAKMRARLRDDG
jgi:hypothetical protein